MQHEADIEYFNKLKELGCEVARKYGINVNYIKPKRRCGMGSFGLAFLQDRGISIEVRDRDLMRDGGKWHKQRHTDECNLNTLAHELAHLQEYQAHGKTGHGPRFKAYMAPLLQTVKERWATKGI